MVKHRKYADHVTALLAGMGYTHCFFVPGGNSMHLLDAARTTMHCVPFVHEVSAAIAAEYFNEISRSGRAFCLVTAGPGLTNLITALSGAYLESRELLVIGGQVKSADLARGEVRQRGIQEVDGVSIASPTCKRALRIEAPIPDDEFVALVLSGSTARKGPVFIEMCLDAQASPVPLVDEMPGHSLRTAEESPGLADALKCAETALQQARRPILLIGGGTSFETVHELGSRLTRLGVPLMTTWNGADRVGYDHPLFMGRPNTWGQRSANVLLSQADLIIAIGTRLGIQQTGFNWGHWTNARVIQIDIDQAELRKGHPLVAEGFSADADEFLRGLSFLPSLHVQSWIEHCAEVRCLIPESESANSSSVEFLSPFELVEQLASEVGAEDIIIPASSGSGQFVPMMVFRNVKEQRMLTNKGNASMGYGLAGAIGASLAADKSRRTFLIEGDGSFSQNLQELGTVAIQQLNLKMFLLDNDGYASIRTTQRNYFNGSYLGCDASTGLGFPDWNLLAGAFGIPCLTIGTGGLSSEECRELLHGEGPVLFVVKVDPEQTYFPKVTSRIRDDGSMESNPIHQMSPPLPPDMIGRISL